MIYIPEVKKRLEELKPRWENSKRKLSPDELAEFYHLIDEVVIEARKTRSAHLDPSDLPEDFLINLISKRIDSTVLKFFKSRKQYLALALTEEKKKQTDLKETTIFKDWASYAIQIVRIIILGDTTRRQDRRKEIDRFLEKFESSEDKFLSLNFLQAKGRRDKLLGVKKPKDMENLKRIGALKEAKRLSQEFDWDDPWEGLDNLKHDGFLIRDEAAISAATKYALSQGNVFYDPNYKPPELKGLINDKEMADAAMLDWEAGNLSKEALNHENIKSKKDYIKWIEKRLIGMPLPILEDKISSYPKKYYNLIAFLFGSKGKAGKLYYRLLDLHKLKATKWYKEKKGAVSLDNSNVKEGTKRKNKLEKEVTTAASTTDITEKEWEEWLSSLPTARQSEIACLYYRWNYSRPEIVRELNISRQAVHKHLKKIEEHIKSHPKDLPIDL